jgi:hypothetical protein
VGCLEAPERLSGVLLRFCLRQAEVYAVPERRQGQHDHRAAEPPVHPRTAARAEDRQGRPRPPERICHTFRCQSAHLGPRYTHVAAAAPV